MPTRIPLTATARIEQALRAAVSPHPLTHADLVRAATVAEARMDALGLPVHVRRGATAGVCLGESLGMRAEPATHADLTRTAQGGWVLTAVWVAYAPLHAAPDGVALALTTDDPGLVHYRALRHLGIELAAPETARGVVAA